MNKKMLVLGIMLVMLATLFVAVMPSVSAEEYKHEELKNSVTSPYEEGYPYRLKCDDLDAGVEIIWDWYAENEEYGEIYSVNIDFWLEDGDGNVLIEKDGYSSDNGKYTVKSAGKYVLVWKYYDGEAYDEFDNIDLYYKLSNKKPTSDGEPTNGGGSEDEDDSTPGFEAITLVAGISIAVAVTLISKKQKKRK